jgi:hypothetical protein
MDSGFRDVRGDGCSVDVVPNGLEGLENVISDEELQRLLRHSRTAPEDHGKSK